MCGTYSGRQSHESSICDLSLIWYKLLTWLQLAAIPDTTVAFAFVGASSVIAGAFWGEGGGEEEADRSHWPCPSAGRGPAECHSERSAKRDRAWLVSAQCEHVIIGLTNSSICVTAKLSVFCVSYCFHNIFTVQFICTGWTKFCNAFYCPKS